MVEKLHFLSGTEILQEELVEVGVEKDGLGFLTETAVHATQTWITGGRRNDKQTQGVNTYKFHTTSSDFGLKNTTKIWPQVYQLLRL